MKSPRARFAIPKVLVVTVLACGAPTQVADGGADSGAVNDAGYVCDAGTTDSGTPDCSCACGAGCPAGACQYLLEADAGGFCTCLA
jgi:hypothetical protein